MDLEQLHAEWFRTIRAIEQAQTEYKIEVQKLNNDLAVKMEVLNAQIQRFIEQEREILDNEHQERALSEE